eukprot:scaffold19191_cov134-Isochrysis_galbana.AAC.7
MMYAEEQAPKQHAQHCAAAVGRCGCAGVLGAATTAVARARCGGAVRCIGDYSGGASGSVTREG